MAKRIFYEYDEALQNGQEIDAQSVFEQIEEEISPSHLLRLDFVNEQNHNSVKNTSSYEFLEDFLNDMGDDGA